MKKKFLLFICLLLCFGAIAQQTIIAKEENPGIEVSGSAELEVVPDEIYVGIVLREKNKNSEKFRIEVQEDNLLKALKDSGFDLKNLSLSGANGDLQYNMFRKGKVITEKNLIMKVKNAEEVNKLFKILDDLEIEDARITRTSHSQIEQLRKETKINAVKAAKEKADYLLAAIGEKTGKPLLIREQDDPIYRSNAYANVALQEVVIRGTSKVSGFDSEIAFTKIKIRCEVFARFSIQ